MRTREDVIEKLKKLRAHQVSAEKIGSEEEAQAFATMFQKILDENKISMSEVEWEQHQKEEPVIKVRVNHKQNGMDVSSRQPPWRIALIRTIAKFQNCHYCLIQASSDFYLYGELIDAEAARDVYIYMAKFAESFSQKKYVEYFYKCKAEGDVTRARGFKESFLNGFVSRLIERYEQNRGFVSQTGLVRFNKAIARAKQFMESTAIGLYQKKGKGMSIKNMEGFRQGKAQADRVNMGAERIA